MQENSDNQRLKLEERITQLENMVIMQEKTINFLTGKTELMDRNM